MRINTQKVDKPKIISRVYDMEQLKRRLQCVNYSKKNKGVIY